MAGPPSLSHLMARLSALLLNVNELQPWSPLEVSCSNTAVVGQCGEQTVVSRAGGLMEPLTVFHDIVSIFYSSVLIISINDF